MTRRRITVELTERQFRALGGAVADADSLDEGEELSPSRRGEAVARDNAWGKIRDAWYSRERRS